MEVTFGLAFIAGLVSFISPCVLPLVPAYIGYMGGRVTHTVSSQLAVSDGAAVMETRRSAANRFSTFMHGVAFVLGFTLVFVILGILVTSVVTGIITEIIGRIGGIIIIFFGLHFMGVMPSVFKRLKKNTKSVTLEDGSMQYTGGILTSLVTSTMIAAAGTILIIWGFTGTLAPSELSSLIGSGSLTIIIALPVLAVFLLGLFLGGAFSQPAVFWLKMINVLETALYSDTRREMDAGKGGLPGSFFMGIVFSAGWTPCIGPIYGAVLTLAANTGDVVRAAPLLLAYSIGLGIPFLLTALLLDSAQGILRHLQRHMRLIEFVSGAILIVIGFLVASGQLQNLSSNFANEFADSSVRTENCLVGFFEGKVPFNQVGPCLGGSLTPLERGSISVAEFTSAGQQLQFTFPAHTGDAIDIQLSRLSSTVLPVITLLSPDGQELTQAEITESQPSDARITPINNFTIPADGIYMITVENSQPYVASQTITDANGQPVEVPLAYRFNIKVQDHDPANDSSSASPDTTTVEGGSGPAVEAVLGATQNADSGADQAIASISALAQESGPAVGLNVGDRAPDFQTVTDGGETIHLSDLRGQVVLLNFWGTWCGPCRVEMPMLQQTFARRSEDGLAILAVSAKDSVEDVQAFRAEFGLTFTLAMDQDESVSSGLYEIPGQPATFVLDRDGVIMARHYGLLVESQLDDILAQVLPTTTS